MKKVLILFHIVHLSLIFYQAFWSIVDSYWNYHFDKTLRTPVLMNLLKQNRYTEPYYILSGINTGYGFYGIHTATKKYLKITFLDSKDKELKADRYFKLSSSNGITRLQVYASFLSNYLARTEKLVRIDTTSKTDIDSSVMNLRENYHYREDYVEKTLKWLGKQEAKNIVGCTSYKIKLLAIVPRDIWTTERKTKPSIYVIKQGVFSVQ